MKTLLQLFNLILFLSLTVLTRAQIVTEFANTGLGYPTTNFVSTPSANAARLTDLDGDGDLDAVVANNNFNTGFSVLLNMGNGKFAPPVLYSSTLAANDIEVADFNNDSVPDVVVSNTGNFFQGTTISVFPGLGNGTFGPQTDYTVGVGPVGLAAADFNLDGYMDLVVANNDWGSGNTVSILLNNTTGGFNAATTISVALDPYKLSAGLIDSDSLPDIVVASDGGTITMLRNTGTGFQTSFYSMQASITSNDQYASVELADIDNDGDLDVFYSSMQTQQVTFRKNFGNGILDSLHTVVLDFWNGGAASFKVIDLNGDGFKDIVASSTSGRTGDGYRMVMNQGNGTFGVEITGTGGQYTLGILAGDIDLDGDNDVLTIDNYSNELTVHPNNGSGQFPFPVLFSNGVPMVSTKLDAADVDNDGDLDIVTSADSRTAINTPVAVSLNNGNGSFAPAVNISGFLGGTGAKFRDVNNDGFVDIIFASGINTAPYDFFTAINNGNGTFASPTRWSMNGCGWNDIDGADLDNDGDIDVIITEWLGCTNVPLSARRIFISYNDGTGNFSPPTIKVVNPFPGPIAICDFNEDGFLDVATGQATDVDISLNDGAGDLLPPTSFAMSQSPYDVLATDLNNDGHADIASCNYGSNPGDYNLTVRLGNGDGTFQSLQLISAAYSPDLANVSGIAAGDVDNDGDVDLIVSQNASNDMSIYLNDGTGTFSFDHRLCAYYGFRSPWFADFDGDGIKDLAGLVDLPPSGLSSALTILPGITTGNATGGSGLSDCGTTTTAVIEHWNISASSIQLSPNPFKEIAQLTFEAEASGNYILSIYNAMGQGVYQSQFSAKAGKQTISLSKNNLPAGLYELQLIGSGRIKKTNAVIE